MVSEGPRGAIGLEISKERDVREGMEAERAAAARCDARGPTTLARVWQRSSRWGGAGGRPAVCWGEGRWRMGGQGGNRGGPATGVTTGRAPLTAEQTCAPAGAASGTAAAVGATAAAATQPGGSPRGRHRLGTSWQPPAEHLHPPPWAQAQQPKLVLRHRHWGPSLRPNQPADGTQLAARA